MLRRTLAHAALLAATSAPALGAQDFGIRPHLNWQTVHTEHFVFHFPAEMRAWTLSVAERIEPIHAAVEAIVGFAPPQRTTVVVEDPLNLPNGSAYPIIGAPAIYLWPTPAEPTDHTGNSRTWGEVLAVHEFAHVAHMSRPTRNPMRRLLWKLLPGEIGPIARKAPRWLYEGYATYVEGKLTGSGRPHGAWRPAVLRQWALEGQLPTYAQLDATGGYKAGSMAYLAGSAYLEWLVARSGDSSLVHLWRRMTARQNRSFDAAFAGVFGAPPAVLYGRFTAELTGKALRIEEELGPDTTARGEIVQKLAWYTGEPALSKDGRLMAIVLRTRDRPSRVVVWRMDEPDTAAQRKLREARERLVERDPEDVPAVQPYPLPKRAVATLRPVAGRAHDDPRFFADGKRILVSRFEPRGDGSVRPDLFEWNTDTKRLRRLTRSGGLRSADPSPDGRAAAAVRCLNGICDLVRVELATGRVEVLAAGSPTRYFHRPRYAPDGRRIVVGVQDFGTPWRLALVDASGGTLHLVGPLDGVNRHSPTFSPSGDSLVYVSERGGIPNVETLDLRTGGTRPLTRVTGAAYAPEPGGRGVYFLSETARGLDLRLVAPSPAPSAELALSAALAPAAPVPPQRADTFARGQLSAPRPYGIGPHGYRWLPGGAVSTEGAFATLLVGSSDPVGRLGWALQGAYGEPSTWRGGALGAEWRRFRPELQGELFYVEHSPSRQEAGTFAPPSLDVEYAGATVGAQLTRNFGARREVYRIGASVGRLRADTGRRQRRQLAFAEYGGGRAFIRGTRFLSVGVDLHGALGTTGDKVAGGPAGDWRRALATGRLAVGQRNRSLTGAVTYGSVSRDASPLEGFVVGGVRSPLADPAILSQRIPAPALPVGIVAGRELYAYRLTLDLVFPLDLYYAAFGTRGGFRDPFRVVGAERSVAIPTLAFLRLPSTRAQAGVAYTLDAPFKHKTRGYFSVEYRP